MPQAQDADECSYLRLRRADDSWEDWEEAAEVPQLPKVNAAPAQSAEDKFAGEDEGEDEPEHDVPKPQQVCACHSLSRIRQLI